MELFISESVGINLVFVSQILQVAVTGFITNRAVKRMVQKEQFQNHFTSLDNIRGRCANNHAFCYRCSAGRNLTTLHLLNFNQTHAASSERFELFVMAQDRYVNPVQFGRFINSRGFWCCDLLIVYCKIYHLDLCPVSLTKCVKILFKCHEPAGIVTGFTFCAFFLVKECKLTLLPDNSIYRTGLFAGAALDTFILNNLPQ